MSEKVVRYVNAACALDVDDPRRRVTWEYKDLALNHRGRTFPHTYRVTVERIDPEPEQPQWWWWYGGDRQWGEPKDGFERKVQVSIGMGGSCCVYGTVSDRDAKRDALLAAARAAGKPEDTDHA